MSRPDLGIVGCKQLAAALGGVTDSDVEATGELNSSASLNQAEALRGRSRGARGGLLDHASGVRPAMGSSLASAIPWTGSVRYACVASWRIRMCSGIAARSSGSRMPSDRFMPGCAHSG